MKLNLQKVIETTLAFGADLPAYKALFDEVVGLFGDEDQASLKAQYAAAMAASDAQHARAQRD